MTTIYFSANSNIYRVTYETTGWIVKKMDVGKEHVQAIAVDAKNNIIYAGTFNDGLQRSTNDGLTFEKIGSTTLHPRIMSIHVSSLTKNHQYQALYVGTEPSMLYSSDDGGSTFSKSPALLDLPSKPTWSFPPRPTTHHVRDIKSGNEDSQFVLVGIELGGIMRTLDGGQSFEDRKENSQFDVHHIEIHPHDDNLLYESGGGGYAYSNDKGTTWRTDNAGLGDFTYLVYNTVDPGDKDVIIVSGARSPKTAYIPDRAETRIFKKVDNAPWKHVTEGLPKEKHSSVMHLLSHSTEPGVFYGVNNTGIYRSNNQGESWLKLNIEWPKSLLNSRINDAVIVE